MIQNQDLNQRERSVFHCLYSANDGIYVNKILVIMILNPRTVPTKVSCLCISPYVVCSIQESAKNSPNL
jgi:hypothetical protein